MGNYPPETSLELSREWNKCKALDRDYSRDPVAIAIIP